MTPLLLSLLPALALAAPFYADDPYIFDDVEGVSYSSPYSNGLNDDFYYDSASPVYDTFESASPTKLVMKHPLRAPLRWSLPTEPKFLAVDDSHFAPNAPIIMGDQILSRRGGFRPRPRPGRRPGIGGIGNVVGTALDLYDTYKNRPKYILPSTDAVFDPVVLAF